MEKTDVLASSNENSIFLKKVYAHLFLAICGFVGLEYLWFSGPVAHKVLLLVSKFNWLWILGAFMIVSWLATRLADNSNSLSTQYIGLALFTVFESLIFIPLLAVAQMKSGADIIGTAGYLTIFCFLALTAIVFFTKVNLSGWGKYLMWGGIVAIGAIACGAIFGFNLGVGFSAIMVCFAGAAILYDTSMILHYTNKNAYVGASLRLFASIAMLFWYILSILNSRD